VARSASNGVLRLSHLGSATLGILPSLLRHFQRDYPSIELNVTMAGTFHQIEMLRRGEVDLGLIRVPIEDARALNVTVLCEEKMLIAVSADHPLAARKSIKVEMLASPRFFSHGAELVRPSPSRPASQTLGRDHHDLDLAIGRSKNRLNGGSRGRAAGRYPSLPDRIHFREVRHVGEPDIR
jgi:DNA-binding transcriptional LysR family regulator